MAFLVHRPVGQETRPTDFELLVCLLQPHLGLGILDNSFVFGKVQYLLDHFIIAMSTPASRTPVGAKKPIPPAVKQQAKKPVPAAVKPQMNARKPVPAGVRPQTNTPKPPASRNCPDEDGIRHAKGARSTSSCTEAATSCVQASASSELRRQSQAIGSTARYRTASRVSGAMREAS